MKRSFVLLLLLSSFIGGCSKEAPTVGDTLQPTAVIDEDTAVDEEIDSVIDEQAVVEDKSSIGDLIIEVDGLPFVLGSTLRDVMYDLESISYKLDANVENRNLNAGQVIEIPIIGEGDRTIGYMTISNKNSQRTEMIKGTLSELTINPKQVLSMSAYGVGSDATISSTRELVGAPDSETGTSMTYKADKGVITYIFKSSGELDGVTIKEVG